MIIIPESIEAFANGIIEILNNPEWVQGASSFNQQIIDWGLNFNVTMAEISNIYSEIV